MMNTDDILSALERANLAKVIEETEALRLANERSRGWRGKWNDITKGVTVAIGTSAAMFFAYVEFYEPIVSKIREAETADFSLDKTRFENTKLDLEAKNKEFQENNTKLQAEIKIGRAHV